MDRWTGILKIPVCPKGTALCRIAVSLYISPSKALLVPTANAIFFNGDRVEGTGNPVIERLSDIQNIADVLVSKFGASINAWWGEPQPYRPDGYPASTSVIELFTNFPKELISVETICSMTMLNLICDGAYELPY
ncbi:uncharacterized protein [Spinacia oleracea]|uniref:Uncharacterized protein n=1 Tax=Spinacia oleracea TaxID=3562 RepID=A0ABM3RNY2_SPIOL|nr:uncharacterized protein LOC130471307 [Spinacia oleracea]